MASQSMKSVVPYEECSPLLADTDGLRHAAAARGYLYVRGLCSAGDILGLRREVLRVTARHGLLRKDKDILGGYVCPGANLSENDYTPEFISYYRDLLRIRNFHALPHRPAILQLLSRLIGEPILIHPRQLYHTIFPGREDHTTAPHQDFYPVRGTPDTWTVWIPLGDCGPELGGGLAFVPGSNRGQLRQVRQHGSEIEVDPDSDWAWAPVMCGDVLLFHGLTIHQGRDNQTTDRMRIAVSFRIQAISEPVDEHSLKPHMRWIDWEGIYADWEKDDPLRYYWKSFELKIEAHG